MAGAGLSLVPYVTSCRSSKTSSAFRKKIVILGVDGMDPVLLQNYIGKGGMPNFRRLIDKGSFMEMSSSIPPQSPVAWSDFAVGANAGVHGIFDFIHRDPKTMTPYFSASQVSEAAHSLSLGDWNIPLGGGAARILREGKPFWEYLGEAGIPTTIFKMPGNFPVYDKKVNSMAGMGTPDILGSYGMFSFYTSRPPVNYKEITGGTVFPVRIINNKITAELAGPVNSLKKDRPNVRIPFVVLRDPRNDVVKVLIGNHELILTTGEWSGWIRLSFDVVPHVNAVKGICKLLVKQIHPDFEMYVSPINIDPSDQALPVTSPPAYGRELVDQVGFFDTKGLPADTKALSYDVLNEKEYIQLSGQILAESRRIMSYELHKLRQQASGVLFFYFSNLDQDSHMYWRALDKDHPSYTPELGRHYSNVVQDLYNEMDKALGDVFKIFDIDDDNFTLIVMSDHGFAPFYRCVNLNTWLLKNGYIELNHFVVEGKQPSFANVEWTGSRVYGLGINALYLNIEGRERYGVVPRREAPELMNRLKRELLEIKDPQTGKQVISNVWIGKELYGREDDKTPDMVIGWNRGYRASWETVLGGFSEEIIVDNNDRWSGDHCIDPAFVPAVLLSNRKISSVRPSLPDVTATIMAECNIPLPRHMTGKPFYGV
jgi:predicted AlkP superfamily phosphohydrolase/phosphomutase